MCNKRKPEDLDRNGEDHGEKRSRISIHLSGAKDSENESDGFNYSEKSCEVSQNS